jgi:hypothetical protein
MLGPSFLALIFPNINPIISVHSKNMQLPTQCYKAYIMLKDIFQLLLLTYQSQVLKYWLIMQFAL